MLHTPADFTAVKSVQGTREQEDPFFCWSNFIKWGTAGAHRRRPPGPLSDSPLCDPGHPLPSSPPPAGAPSSRFIFLLTLPSDFYGGGAGGKEDPAGNTRPKEAPTPPHCHPAGRMKARSREGPLPPRGGEGLGRRRLGPGGECRARASGFPVPRPSSQVARSRPCRCTVRPLLGPLGGNRLPAQVGSLEALNVAFQKFFKLPRPAQHSRVALFPRSLHPRYSCSTGCAGWGKGAGRRRLRGRSPTSGARLGLERLEIRSLCRPRRKRRHAAPAPHQPEGEGVGGEGRGGGEEERAGGGGGHVHITRVPVPGASQGTI
ncbi:unnamed protein product [Rangifer tarandus platyrhynchus]|uniref:Uncharacterized protein n=1 Tax=Rangifer tarandus platyrhynchus TaxID=3082113 RepID=A0AC59Y3C4_RANTA